MEVSMTRLLFCRRACCSLAAPAWRSRRLRPPAPTGAVCLRQDYGSWLRNVLSDRTLIVTDRVRKRYRLTLHGRLPRPAISLIGLGFKTFSGSGLACPALATTRWMPPDGGHGRPALRDQGRPGYRPPDAGPRPMHRNGERPAKLTSGTDILLRRPAGMTAELC